MRFRFGKVIMVLAVAGIVTACNKSVDTSAPDKLVRDGVQKLWTQDAKFNFSGSVKLDASAKNSKNDKVSTAKGNSASETLAGSDANTELQLQQQHVFKQYKDIFSLISNSFTILYTGGVDWPKGKVEIIPEYRYEAKNALVSFKFPVQFDINKLKVFIDASAINNVSDSILKQIDPTKVVGDRYVTLAAPQDVVKRLPFSDLLKNFPQALDDGFASVDAKSFSKVSVDDYGKKVNAKYQVKLTTNGKENIKTTIAILDSLSKALQQQGQVAATKKGQYQQQDYAVLQQFIDRINGSYKQQFNDNSQQNPYAEYLKQMEKMPMVYNYYFDDKGRIIALQGNLQLIAAPYNPFGANLFVIFEQKIDYSTPKFIMEPTEQNTFDISSQLGLY